MWRYIQVKNAKVAAMRQLSDNGVFRPPTTSLQLQGWPSELESAVNASAHLFAQAIAV
jgi:hypothetical protein